MRIDARKFLEECTALPGTPGYERAVAEYIARAFAPLCDETIIDALGSMTAKMGSNGPHVMISAHMDEIGLVATRVEKDGSLRFCATGGVDPRILPAAEVRVQAREGELYGVIGAKAPHLLTAEERSRAPKIEDMYIDLGMDEETVKRLVRPGDQIVLRAQPVSLDGARMAGKTMDDRASVAAMLLSAELLSRIRPKAQVCFVASAQEEIGGWGAQTSAFGLAPDVGIAIDVTHGEGPGTGKWEAFPLDKVVLTVGPTTHPALVKLARKVAKENHITIADEISGGETWTDADNIQVARTGVPTLLISIPLRYMHTTVETLDLDTVREAARLMALFIVELAEGWEEMKWF